MGRRADTEADLNLLPIMNLFVVLIPFLLMGISFLQIGALSASTPIATSGGEDASAPPTVVYLAVNAETYTVNIEPGPEEAASWEALEQPFSRAQDQVLEQVIGSLQQIKDAASAPPTLILIPDGEIPYADVIEVMGRARDVFPQITVTRLARAS